MIEVEAVSKAFSTATLLDRMLRRRPEPVRVLEDFSMVARNGEITALVGPNGVGKTTLFRMCAGIMPVDSGRIRVDGYDVARDGNRVRERLALLTETRGFYTTLSVREHIRVYGQLRGLQGSDLERRIDQGAERFGMGSYIDRRAKGLSRGQSMKLSLCRVMTVPPPNLILDEPTAALDFMSSQAVWEAMVELKSQGAAILISSHIASEVVELADRIIIARGGRATMSGTMAEFQALTGASTGRDVLLALFKDTRED